MRTMPRRVAELAGVAADPMVDGRSFRPACSRPSSAAGITWRRALPVAHWFNEARTVRYLPTYRGVRTADHL